MIVCHCKRVTDRDIHAAVDAGARTEADIARACGAGTCCGGCRSSISEVLETRVPGPGVVFLPMAKSA